MITPTSDAYYFACILGGILLLELLIVWAGITVSRLLARRKSKNTPVWITQIFK